LSSGANVYGPAGQLLGTAYFTKGRYVSLKPSGNGYTGDCLLTAVLPNFLAESAYKVHIAKGMPNGDPTFTAAALANASWQSYFLLDYATYRLIPVTP
jgi:hypothetical protein